MSTRSTMFALCVCLVFVALFSTGCVQQSSEEIVNEAFIQLLDFFHKQNLLKEPQEHFEFQGVLDVKRLNRKQAEVTAQYVYMDNYMTVDRTNEIKQSVFLLEWKEEGRLVVPPEGDAVRVYWLLTETWNYKPENEE